MSFQNKTLSCADCGAAFDFTAEEQEFFQTKGYHQRAQALSLMSRGEKV